MIMLKEEQKGNYSYALSEYAHILKILEQSANKNNAFYADVHFRIGVCHR